MGHAVQLTGQRPTRWRSTVCHNATPNLNSCPHSVVPCSHTCGRNGNARRVRLCDAVELEFYRLQQVSSGAIQLGDDDPQVAGPSAVGTGRPEEPTAPLSEIIQRLNERFGTRFAEADRLFFEQLARASAQVDEIQRTAKANTFEKFYLGTRERVIKVIINRNGRKRRDSSQMPQRPRLRPGCPPRTPPPNLRHDLGTRTGGRPTHIVRCGPRLAPRRRQSVIRCALLQPTVDQFVSASRIPSINVSTSPNGMSRCSSSSGPLTQ